MFKNNIKKELNLKKDIKYKKILQNNIKIIDLNNKLLQISKQEIKKMRELNYNIGELEFDFKLDNNIIIYFNNAVIKYLKKKRIKYLYINQDNIQIDYKNKLPFKIILNKKINNLTFLVSKYFEEKININDLFYNLNNTKINNMNILNYSINNKINININNNINNNIILLNLNKIALFLKDKKLNILKIGNVADDIKYYIENTVINKIIISKRSNYFNKKLFSNINSLLNNIQYKNIECKIDFEIDFEIVPDNKENNNFLYNQYILKNKNDILLENCQFLSKKIILDNIKNIELITNNIEEIIINKCNKVNIKDEGAKFIKINDVENLNIKYTNFYLVFVGNKTYFDIKNVKKLNLEVSLTKGHINNYNIKNTEKLNLKLKLHSFNFEEIINFISLILKLINNNILYLTINYEETKQATIRILRDNNNEYKNILKNKFGNLVENINKNWNNKSKLITLISLFIKKNLEEIYKNQIKIPSSFYLYEEIKNIINKTKVIFI